MSNRYQGSQVSTDVKPAKDLTPVKPIPPSFRDRGEWEGFQLAVKQAWLQGLLPESIKNFESAIVIASKGRELGLDPLYALSVIYLVHGKPSLEGEAMLGLVLRKYPNAHVRWVKATHSEAVLELGRPGGPVSTFSFTVQDAIRAGMVQKQNPDGTIVAAPKRDVWRQYTRKMLCWRAISEGVTLLFPECIQGCLTPDELRPVETNTASYATAEDIENEVRDALPTPLSQTEYDTIDAAKELEREVELDRPTAPPPAPTVVTPEVMPAKPKGNGEFVFPSGQFFGKKIKDLPEAQLRGYAKQLELRAQRVSDPANEEMIRHIREFLG